MWWEFDLTWCAIWLLEKVGIAKDVVRPDLKDALARNRALAALRAAELSASEAEDEELALSEAVTVTASK